MLLRDWIVKAAYTYIYVYVYVCINSSTRTALLYPKASYCYAPLIKPTVLHESHPLPMRPPRPWPPWGFQARPRTHHALLAPPLHRRHHLRTGARRTCGCVAARGGSRQAA